MDGRVSVPSCCDSQISKEKTLSGQDHSNSKYSAGKDHISHLEKVGRSSTQKCQTVGDMFSLLGEKIIHHHLHNISPSLIPQGSWFPSTQGALRNCAEINGAARCILPISQTFSRKSKSSSFSVKHVGMIFHQQ